MKNKQIERELDVLYLPEFLSYKIYWHQGNIGPISVTVNCFTLLSIINNIFFTNSGYSNVYTNFGIYLRNVLWAEFYFFGN